MSLLRIAARTMLASFFVNEGVKALTKPDEHVAAADPIARKVVPLAQKVAPAQYASWVPEETRALVQISGAAQVAGGLLFATGIARRPGAALLALTSVPHVIASVKNPADATDSEKRAGRSILLRNVALLGATVLAAQDTQGKPGLTWRAEDTSHRIGRAAEKKAKALSRDAEKASKNAKKELKKARKQLESALPGN